jgi:hypothetical protein
MHALPWILSSSSRSRKQCDHRKQRRSSSSLQLASGWWAVVGGSRAHGARELAGRRARRACATCRFTERSCRSSVISLNGSEPRQPARFRSLRMSVEGINAGVTAATRAARVDRPTTSDKLTARRGRSCACSNARARDYPLRWRRALARESAVTLEPAPIPRGVVATASGCAAPSRRSRGRGRGDDSSLARATLRRPARGRRSPAAAPAADAADPTRLLPRPHLAKFSCRARARGRCGCLRRST